jgi:hypothetical protein
MIPRRYGDARVTILKTKALSDIIAIYFSRGDAPSCQGFRNLVLRCSHRKNLMLIVKRTAIPAEG